MRSSSYTTTAVDRRETLTGLASAVVMATAPPGAGARAMQSCRSETIGGVAVSRLAALSRGVNIDGWLNGDLSREPKDAPLRELHRLGMTHVRLPVGAERLMEKYSSAAATAELLDVIDRAVDRLEAIGFAVTLDMHPARSAASGHAAEPDTWFTQLSDAWRRLSARHSRRSPERLYFELLNEPTISAELWRAQAAGLVEQVREIAPEHTLIYGPGLDASKEPQGIGALAGAAPFNDDNIVYAVHYYRPYVFTHQGATWGDDARVMPVRKLPWEVSAEHPDVAALIESLDAVDHAAAIAEIERAYGRARGVADVEADFAQLADWSTLHGRPVIVNEFGIYREHAPRESRLSWLRAVRQAAEDRCIGWTHWDYGRGFGLLDRNADMSLDGDAVEALLARPSDRRTRGE